MESIPNDYRDFSAQKLREMLLNNTLESDLMDFKEYEKLFGYEIKLEQPSVVVLEFCNKGLRQYDKYNIDISKPSFISIRQKYNAQNKRQIVYKVAQQVAIFLVIITLATFTAAALGYNVVDLIRVAVSSPEKTVIDFDDKEVIRTDDARFYSSMKEMLETEKLNILYPVKLPVGYTFVDFEVIDFGTHLEVRALATEPYITFIVGIGANIQIDNYENEASNGIKYNIFDMGDGLHQAHWSDGGNYYEIVVGDKAILSLIIENLEESRGN